MDYFAVLAPHEQLIKTTLRICQWTQGNVQSRIYWTLCLASNWWL